METTRQPRVKRNTFQPTLKAPDWSAWQRVPSAELWEAVALSCGIEPICVVGWMEPRPISCEPLSEFLARLRQAVACLQVNGGSLPCQLGATRPQQSRVNLGDFRAWANSEGWQLPESFPNFIARRPQEESAQERGRRLALLVDAEIAKGASKANAFRIVAPNELSLKPKYEGEKISWETLKKIYERQKALQSNPPTTPAKH